MYIYIRNMCAKYVFDCFTCGIFDFSVLVSFFFLLFFFFSLSYYNTNRLIRQDLQYSNEARILRRKMLHKKMLIVYCVFLKLFVVFLIIIFF